jgi:hypothetical protein
MIGVLGVIGEAISCRAGISVGSIGTSINSLVDLVVPNSVAGHRVGTLLVGNYHHYVWLFRHSSS